MIKRRIFTKLRFQFGRHSSFSTKWRCLIFLVGFFRSFGSGDEKGIDFYQRGCLRLWCFQSSVLEVAKKYIIAKSSFLRQWRYGVFSEEVWSSSGRKKQVDFFTAVRKNKSIFLLSSKADRRFRNGREKHHYEFFFQMCRSCSPSSLIRHSQSSRWFFSVVLLEDVIVEDWGGFMNSSFFLGRTREPLLWPNSNHWSRENAGAEAAFFFFRLGCCSGAFYILGSAGFFIRMVSNK